MSYKSKDQLNPDIYHLEHHKKYMTSSAEDIFNNNENIFCINGSIKNFYKNAVIFITGGTGFLGKVLIEKLLRSCDEIKSVYILVRPKRSLSSEQRYKEFVKHQVFDRIRVEQPTALDKLVCVPGDITQPLLGLKESDVEMILENVNIVFHSAATVKFNEGLKEAANLNAFGTQRLLDLCSKMITLKSVVHVSTAYSNPGRKYVGETVYPPVNPLDKDTFMKCVRILPKEVLDPVAGEIQGAHPNTYTLTKSVAEEIVFEYSEKFPISIIRPSIVTAAIEEPFPGWVDNIQGITGIMMEIGRGTISSILGDKNCICDIIPVDVVVNTVIGAAWAVNTESNTNFKVFNCTSGQIRPILWQTLGDITVKWARVNPSKYITMYPKFSYRKSEFMHWVYEMWFQLLPAYILDVIVKLQGSKPMMMKIARKIQTACHTGKFFSLHEWIFDNSNQKALAKCIKGSIDGNEFECCIENLNYNDYIRNYMLGIRKYILKDGDDSIDKARKKLLGLYLGRSALKAAVLILVIYLILNLWDY